VSGYPGELRPEHLTAVAVYSDMEPTGTFASSHPLLNQLQHNIQWGQKGNFVDVPTDCPQRDERPRLDRRRPGVRPHGGP
jgi:alpha-L-rhamnosidase